MLLFVTCEPVTPQQTAIKKTLILDNYEYEDIVGNARVLVANRKNVDQLDNPVIQLGEGQRLKLVFDILTEDVSYLSAKIIHCDRDWQKSRLQDIEFLSSINNFRINQFNNSLNTVVPYVQYEFMIPKPLLSGNYVVAVYRRSNPNDLLLTRRFILIEISSKGRLTWMSP
jgi:hypothetical protein